MLQYTLALLSLSLFLHPAPASAESAACKTASDNVQKAKADSTAEVGRCVKERITKFTQADKIAAARGGKKLEDEALAGCQKATQAKTTAALAAPLSALTKDCAAECKDANASLESTRKDGDAKIADANAKVTEANAKVADANAKLADAKAKLEAAKGDANLKLAGATKVPTLYCP